VLHLSGFDAPGLAEEQGARHAHRGTTATLPRAECMDVGNSRARRTDRILF